MANDAANIPGATPPPSDQAKRLALYVFLATLFVQSIKFFFYIADGEMWAHEIFFLLTRNPAALNFNAAYGHPGTTLLELGSLLHLVSGLSYYPALAFSTAFLVAVLTAACSALCYLLKPRSLWWFTTAFILTFSRFYIDATPPVAVVMPFMTLFVLLSCWLWKQEVTAARRFCILFGILIGLSAATRLDVTLFVACPLFALFCYRTGLRSPLPGVAGGVAAFFASNPFLWFMPFQHLKDLLHKFTYHYAQYNASTSLTLSEWLYAVPLSVLAIIWSLLLLRRQNQEGSLAKEVLLTYGALTVVAVGFLISSKFQAVRYLYPFLIVWEVILAHFVLEMTEAVSDFSPSSLRINKRTVLALLGFVIPTQIIGYLWVFRCFGAL
ncbi:hypothetical protein [Geomonas sp.]|uniref:hypothetical protein n=1 Tax=Geomonas sp. TaxID=2651584 RepID=UPI002B48549B|nr:hypothetical protein [Geomonas sp.]HJV34830.1 hypothetical protein [Geomonas sp.]